MRQNLFSKVTETSAVGRARCGIWRSVKNIFSVFCLAGGLCRLPATAQSAPGDEHWDSRFGPPGVDGAVLAIAVQGNETYVGGSLCNTFGNVVATNIAKWDGQNWTALGGGISSAEQAMVVRIAFGANGDVYAGGVFTTAGGIAATNIARWNGVSWSPLGGGVMASVIAIAVNGNQVYVGGAITNAGGVSVKALARWDGTNWSSAGGGVDAGTNTSVSALLMDGNNLYVGGNFTNAGGQAINRIAKWDGTNWSALGNGITGNSNAAVRAILKSGTNLFVAGSFTNAGGVAATNIARWDGIQWAALGGGISTPVSALSGNGPFVFAGGTIRSAGGIAVTNVARWDGTNWANIGGLTSPDPTQVVGMYDYALAVNQNGELLAGGYFTMAGTNAIQCLAKWDGTNWDAFGAEAGQGFSLSSPVYGLAVKTNVLFAGGMFASAGRAVANQIARWNGTNWSALGAGIVGKMTIGRVAAVALNGPDLYIGGTFTNAGGVTASNIARWNGTSWSPVGSGMNNSVTALAADGANVYAGGSFTVAGGVSASRIAKWNGATWSALGTGVDNNAVAIAVGVDGIYAGGSFTTAGGTNANRIARWDGANWLPLGPGTTNGLDGNVTAIAVSGSTVYAGGNFTTAGGLPASMVAKWDGTTWTNLGPGIQGSTVYALAVIGNRLYVGGQFTKAGGLSTTNVACWDDGSWTTLGTGNSANGASPIGVVTALAAWGNDLYVGGTFQRIGQKPAFRICRWNDQTTFLPPTALQLANPVMLPDGRFQVRVGASGGASYVLETTTNLTDWRPLLTNSVGASDFVDSSALNLPAQFYRTRQVP
jgi:trimeric autotransporter adhesin